MIAVLAVAILALTLAVMVLFAMMAELEQRVPATYSDDGGWRSTGDSSVHELPQALGAAPAEWLPSARLDSGSGKC